MQIFDWIKDGMLGERTRYKRVGGIRPAAADRAVKEGKDPSGPHDFGRRAHHPDPNGVYAFGTDAGHRALKPKGP